MNFKQVIKNLTLIILALELSAYCSDNTSRSSLSGNISFDTTATLSHINVTPALTGTVSGLINCSLIPSGNNSYSVTLRVEAGNEPTYIGMSLLASDMKNSVGTAEFPLILTSPDTTVDMLYNWIRLKKNRKNPALIFELSAQSSIQLDMPAGYTNARQIDAKAFIIDNRQDTPIIYQYATITIPSQALSLSFSSPVMSDAVDNNSIRLTCSSISFRDIPKNLLKKFLGKVKIKGSSCSASCTDFTAVQHHFLPEAVSFLSSVSSLKMVLTDLYATPDIKIAPVRQLIRDIEHAEKLQRSAKQLQAVSKMIGIKKNLQNLLQSGDIPEDMFPVLVLHTSGIIKTLVKANTSICDLRFTLAPPVFSNLAATWYVDQSVIYPAPDGTDVPNGSVEYPFVSISQALECASGMGIVNITLYVFSGYYDKPLLIDRNTTLNAVVGGMAIISAPIVNLSESALNINGFYLMHSEAPGAVFVSNSGAVTSISNTVVQDAVRFGIYQYEGDITLNNVRVYRTESEPGLQLFGTGICLRGGVQAVFSDVISSNNQSFGLVAEHSGTNLIAANLTVNNNILNRNYAGDYEANPTMALYFAGMTVRHNATADISILRMAGNEGAGIIAYDNGSVRITDMTINDTVAYEPTVGWPGTIRYGAGSALWARSGGYINATNFLITRSDLAGAMIGTGGSMDLSYGEVSYNPIGVAIFEDTFDYRRLTDHVRYRENDTDLQATTLPIPDTGL